MNVNETMSIVTQLESIVELAERFEFSREEIFQSILNVAANLEDLADELDEAMYEELGRAYEKYDDAMVVGG
jgi:predicted DNA-binding protein YlxM (UPF0122 family)